MPKKRIMVRIADILGDPVLMKQTGMTREKYQVLVKTYGLDNARSKRLPVEVDA